MTRFEVGSKKGEQDDERGADMTKMNMVWVAVASCLHPDVRSASAVSREKIDKTVDELFHTEIPSVMLNGHLVGSVDRHADRTNDRRGGSRNRYLSKNQDGRFRLYKKADGSHDGKDKDGPYCPSRKDIDEKYYHLVEWYNTQYFASIE